MDQLPLIIIIIASVLALIGIGVLLYFTVFAHYRARKQVRELSLRFEYLHALLFGQDSQYIKRIENISSTNLIYVDTFLQFSRRYKDVRDKSDSAAQIAINNLKDLVSEGDYKELKVALPEAKKVLGRFDTEVNSLNNDLLVVIKPEEECRQESLLLKEKLRKIKQDYYIKQADLGLVSASFDQVFTRLDERFNGFESYVESAQYEEAKNLLPQMAGVIDALGKAIKEMPNLCVEIQSVIPDKLISLQNRFEEMKYAGYPLHHLIVEGNFAEMRTDLTELTKRMQNFDLDGVQDGLDALLARIDDYFSSFDKEKDARVVFESECEGIYRDNGAVEKKYIHLSNALPDVKKIYVIPTDEQTKIDLIKTDINKAGATKRSLDTFIHSGTKQPYSLLVEKRHTLRDETNEASVAIEDFTRYLHSLKADTEEAANCLPLYDRQLHENEFALRKIGLDAITEKYQAVIDDLYLTIDEIYGLLHAPIDVVRINELLSHLKTSGDSVARGIHDDAENMYLADASMLYANRDRLHLNEIQIVMSQAEVRYFSGDFQGAYTLSTEGMKRLRGE